MWYLFSSLYLYHIFIYSSVNGHLGCSISWKLSKSSVKMEVHIYFKLVFLFSSDEYPEMKLLYLVALFLIF